MTKFRLKFWMGALGAAAMSSAIFIAIAVFYIGNNPPKPPIRVWDRTYLSAYVGLLDHYLFKFGLFGVGDRIRNAEVLILGSSHAEFGLSAETISTMLSARRGRPVAAFNLGVASDGTGFAREILEANKAQGQALIVDLYANNQGRLSGAAQKAMQTDIFGAYVAVAALTADYVKDWLFDGLLPRINFGLGARMRADRFLYAVITRRRDNGDVVEVWAPVQGRLFQNVPEKTVTKVPTNSTQLKGPPPTLLPEYAAYLASRKFSVGLTLIPYDGYRLDEAKRFAEQIGVPFVEIVPDDLQAFDPSHLDAVGRDVATRRLIDRWSETAPR